MKTHSPSGVRPPAQFQAVLAWSTLIGLGGGALGFVYLAVLHTLEHAIGPGVLGPWLHLVLMTVVGLVVGQLVRMLGPSGDIELLVDNVHVLGSGRVTIRQLRTLVPVSLLCIGSGGGAGPEAPLVQSAGTIARSIAERLRFSTIDRRVLVISGMASAFSVLFGAPIGAALFALEILHRRGLQYYEAILPAVVSSLVGYGIYVWATGLGLTPTWNLAMDAQPVAIDLVWAIGIGLIAAVIAVAFTRAVESSRRLLASVPELWRPAIGGLVLGLLSLLSPYALTYGKHQINELFTTVAGPAPLFLLAALAKFAGTTTTVASGWRGGFIIPLFFMGAAIGHSLHLMIPTTNHAVLCCAFMAAVNTGVTKTPLGSTLVVSKMVGLSLIPTTAVASIVALLLTHRTGLMPSQRERESLDTV